VSFHTQQSAESDDPANAGCCEIRGQRYQGVGSELVYFRGPGLR
jgi:hypothetical protein